MKFRFVWIVAMVLLALPLVSAFSDPRIFIEETFDSTENVTLQGGCALIGGKLYVQSASHVSTGCGYTGFIDTTSTIGNNISCKWAQNSTSVGVQNVMGYIATSRTVGNNAPQFRYEGESGTPNTMDVSVSTGGARVTTGWLPTNTWKELKVIFYENASAAFFQNNTQYGYSTRTDAQVYFNFNTQNDVTDPQWLDYFVCYTGTADLVYPVVPSDTTCDCPASGDWVIPSTYNCQLTTDCNMQGNNVQVTGGGILDILSAKISNFGYIVTHGASKLICRSQPCFG